MTSHARTSGSVVSLGWDGVRSINQWRPRTDVCDFFNRFGAWSLWGYRGAL